MKRALIDLLTNGLGSGFLAAPDLDHGYMHVPDKISVR